MQTERGELMPWEKAQKEDPINIESYQHGETVQVKTGFFEIVKVDLRRQRLVLKPIPRPREKPEVRDFQDVLEQRDAIAHGGRS